MDPTAPHRPADPHPTASGATAPPIPLDADPGLRLDPDLFPDYRLLRSLGKGGMGEVFLAKNLRLDRHEAIKVIHPGYCTHPGAVERFQREVRNAAQYQDQHIVTVYGYLQSGDTIGFAMEHVPGQTLSEVVKAKGPLAVPLACHYARQVALGLQRAHEKGMVHRDIKPGNLILRKDGPKHLVKILDFGLSKAAAEGPADVELTGAGRAMGTPAYAAPEQAVDAAAADTRSDIYSLGATLFFLLTGRPPFVGSSAIELWTAHAATPAPAVSDFRPDVPVDLAAIVARMLAKDPGQRYQSPAEVAAALVPFIKGGGKGSSGAMVVAPELPPTAGQSTAGGLMETSPVGVARSTHDAESAVPRSRRQGLLLVWIAPGLVLATLIGLWVAGMFRGKDPDRPPGGDGSAAKAGELPVVGRPRPPEFTPLFNGKDLTGWKHVGPRPGRWWVDDGALFGRGEKREVILATERNDFGDFELEVRALHADYAAAAVYVRFYAGGILRGYRVALGGVEGKGKKMVPVGSVRRDSYVVGGKDPSPKYDLVAPKQKVLRNDALTLRITVRGNTVATSVNDGPAYTFTDDESPLPAGQIALWLSGDTAVQVKGVGVRELR